VAKGQIRVCLESFRGGGVRFLPSLRLDVEQRLFCGDFSGREGRGWNTFLVAADGG